MKTPRLASGDVAVWLLKVKPEANQNELLGALNGSTYSKLFETVNSLADDDKLLVTDSFTLSVSSEKAAEITYGVTKPVVSGVSRRENGSKVPKTIRDMDAGVQLEVKTYIGKASPKIAVRLNKTILKPVDLGDDFRTMERGNLAMSNELVFKEDGTTAILTNSEGQVWILVVGTKQRK